MQKNALEQLIDSLDDADGASIAVLRMATPNVVPAIHMYADFMQKLQGEISKGHKAVRDAARTWERDALAKLAVPTSRLP